MLLGVLIRQIVGLCSELLMMLSYYVYLAFYMAKFIPQYELNPGPFVENPQNIKIDWKMSAQVIKTASGE